MTNTQQAPWRADSDTDNPPEAVAVVVREALLRLIGRDERDVWAFNMQLDDQWGPQDEDVEVCWLETHSRRCSIRRRTSSAP